MSFQIERGLFKFDFTDHHAVLGVPVDADEKEVRKQYLKIARRLHPDSCKSDSEAEKKKANELLTKLVNPAYEQLSRSNREYTVSLGHMGKRLVAEGGKVSVSSAAAKQLAQSAANLDHVYKTALKTLASKEYESLDLAVDKIAEISELNMVYLMLKGRSGKPTVARSATATAAAGKTTTGNPATATGTTPSAAAGSASAGTKPAGEISRVDAYIRRAEGYLGKNNFASAVLELREALKLEQTNSKCHSLLGLAYLKQNQVSMAKVHINKALQLNPNDENALKGKQFIDKLAEKTGAGGKSKDGSKPQEQSGGGGLFGGLFGGKKH